MSTVVVDPDTIIAGVAALISAVAAFVAIWNANSASKQAAMAEEQADAAKIQAEEAMRSADAAWVQLDDSRHQYRASLIERQHEAFESVLKGSREYERLLARCVKIGDYGQLDDSQKFGIVDDLPSANPHFKILSGTLPDAELKRALYHIGIHSTRYMGAALLLISARGENDIDKEAFRREIKEHRQKLHEWISRFEHLGEDYFEAELRRLSQQWSARIASTDQ